MVYLEVDNVVGTENCHDLLTILLSAPGDETIVCYIGFTYQPYAPLNRRVWERCSEARHPGILINRRDPEAVPSR